MNAADERGDEHLRAIHSAAGCDRAADRGDRTGGRCGVLAAARLAVAAGRLPDDLASRRTCRARVRRSWPRRSPRRSNVNSAISPGVTEMTSASYLGSTSDHAAVRSEPQHRRRRARCAGGDQCGARPICPRTCRNNPTYRKVNPADAPIMILALTSNIYEPGQLYDAASTILQQRLSQIAGRRPGESSAAARCRRVRVDVNPTQLNNTGLGLEDVRSDAEPAKREHRPKGSSPTNATTADILRERSVAQSRRLRAADRRVSQRRARQPCPTSRTCSDSVENIRAAGTSNGKPAHPADHLSPTRREHHRHRRPR